MKRIGRNPSSRWTDQRGTDLAPIPLATTAAVPSVGNSAYTPGYAVPASAPRLIIPGLSFTPCRLPYPPDRVLTDSDQVAVDDLQLTALHTPGHSGDSLCFHGHGTLFIQAVVQQKLGDGFAACPHVGVGQV